jgi:hypothetical protein
MSEEMIEKIDGFRRNRYGNDTIDDFNTKKIQNPNLFLNDFLRQRYGNKIIDAYNEYTNNNETVDNMSLNDFIKINKSVGGNRKINKKSILGKVRCIYKIQGDRKEYLRYKGDLITVKDYKERMKAKAAKAAKA